MDKYFQPTPGKVTNTPETIQTKKYLDICTDIQKTLEPLQAAVQELLEKKEITGNLLSAIRINGKEVVKIADQSTYGPLFRNLQDDLIKTIENKSTEAVQRLAVGTNSSLRSVLESLWALSEEKDTFNDLVEEISEVFVFNEQNTKKLITFSVLVINLSKSITYLSKDLTELSKKI